MVESPIKSEVRGQRQSRSPVVQHPIIGGGGGYNLAEAGHRCPESSPRGSVPPWMRFGRPRGDPCLESCRWLIKEARAVFNLGVSTWHQDIVQPMFA